MNTGTEPTTLPSPTARVEAIQRAFALRSAARRSAPESAHADAAHAPAHLTDYSQWNNWGNWNNQI